MGIQTLNEFGENTLLVESNQYFAIKDQGQNWTGYATRNIISDDVVTSNTIFICEHFCSFYKIFCSTFNKFCSRTFFFIFVAFFVHKHFWFHLKRSKKKRRNYIQMFISLALLLSQNGGCFHNHRNHLISGKSHFHIDISSLTADRNCLTTPFCRLFWPAGPLA